MKTTPLDKITLTEYTKWVDRVVEMEELLLEAKQCLTRYDHIFIHPSVMKMRKQWESIHNDLLVRHESVLRIAKTYERTNNLLREELQHFRGKLSEVQKQVRDYMENSNE
jgi:alpha/beta superfamily hydrolase